MKKNLIITFSIIFQNILAQNTLGSIGINTATPDHSASLEVYGTNKGFLPPRVSLSDKNDATTIPNPATGLVVFNTNTSDTFESGLYYNNGTSIAPNWIQAKKPDTEIYKTPLQPISNEPVINAGDLSFRVTNERQRLQIKSNTNNINYIDFITEFWLPSGYSAQQNGGIATDTFAEIAGSTSLSSQEMNQVRVYDTTSQKVYLYEVTVLVSNGTKFISQIVTVY